MKYVLDASVGLKWVLNEVDTTIAQRVRDGFRNGAQELISPDCYVLEVAHGLTKAERRGFVPDAAALWNELMLDCPQLFPSLPLMIRAMAIARQAGISVYDCLYVALAEREGCDLLTADARVINSLQSTFPFITPLAAVP